MNLLALASNKKKPIASSGSGLKPLEAVRIRITSKISMDVCSQSSANDKFTSLYLI